MPNENDTIEVQVNRVKYLDNYLEKINKIQKKKNFKKL
jgi:hypothetical protein